MNFKTIRSILFIMIFINYISPVNHISATQVKTQPIKSISFEELNQYENLIEETETSIHNIKEIKISAPVQYALQIGSWLFVQYHTWLQKIAAWKAILVNSTTDNDDE